jgi:protein tyrosine phosphatase (PTP) superfamily phosphohydrolase (DUF442 family)
MNPQVLTAADAEPEAFDTVSQFTFGPYPTRERLLQLKQEGYTAVIPLLHPAVVPFEPKLLADEQALAEEIGIEVIHAPMLPWVGENEASLKKIKEIARTGQGRYYVHCYLGKDRVNVVKRIVEQVVGAPAGTESAETRRLLDDEDAFERGKIYHLADQVYVAPYPTDEELFSYILNGSIRHVVSLLDPSNPDDIELIDKEQATFEIYEMPFTLSPISSQPYDPEQVLQVAEHVRTLPRPVVVHAFRSDSLATEAFLQAYMAHVPPLPPSLFQEPMAGGDVTVVAPNIAVGPRPTLSEFSSYLHPRGVRGIVYVGEAGAPDARKDQAAAQAADLEWQAFRSDDPSLFETIKSGGPWYVYGPEQSVVQQQIADQLGPAIPGDE